MSKINKLENNKIKGKFKVKKTKEFNKANSVTLDCVNTDIEITYVISTDTLFFVGVTHPRIPLKGNKKLLRELIEEVYGISINKNIKIEHKIK